MNATFFHFAIGQSFFHGHDDGVAYGREALFTAAQYFETLQDFRPGVVTTE
jgi:hypothetical protein